MEETGCGYSDKKVYIFIVKFIGFLCLIRVRLTGVVILAAKKNGYKRTQTRMLFSSSKDIWMWPKLGW